MSEPAKTNVEMTDFPGLVLNVAGRDLPPGAAGEQTNLACLSIGGIGGIGELCVRRGYRQVTFEN